MTNSLGGLSRSTSREAVRLEVDDTILHGHLVYVVIALVTAFKVAGELETSKLLRPPTREQSVQPGALLLQSRLTNDRAREALLAGLGRNLTRQARESSPTEIEPSFQTLRSQGVLVGLGPSSPLPRPCWIAMSRPVTLFAS